VVMARDWSARNRTIRPSQYSPESMHHEHTEPQPHSARTIR
jgi:hypothetical protein